ncbi:thioredoxin-like domain-containing protein [Sphingosinicella microcystinivorans]|uniref:thioredoxin-like domain-containing protein n=1 Tax=Sphingosinicella microcystinivorans TaxID=335406 RepID=UPI0022F4039C|nr:thioredoxin-like domain-containing protein [Sphingosinicella microcystinivorans]WBX84617.1 redoxin family protein [Sphingosinicella microcystinivorans]
MIEGLAVSQILLWLLVACLAVVCLALVRQVGALYERIAPVGALTVNQKLSGGSTAPAIVVETLDGQRLSIGKGEDKVRTSQLIFFLAPTCPICKTLLPVLKSIRQHERAWLNVILASDGGDDAEHRAFVKKNGLQDFPYVRSETLGRSYGVSRLPYAVLIDEGGKVSALGLVNSREHLESLFEARTLGTPTIQDFLEKHSGAAH